MDYIRVRDRSFTLQEKPIRLRGFGIGTWLCLEHFLIGLPTPESMIKSAFSERYGVDIQEKIFRNFRDSFLAEDDFKLLKECGVNLIRVPFHYGLFLDDNHPGTYLNEGFRCFDRLFALCRQYGIYAMIDLHATPGSQNPDWHSDNLNGVPQFWQYKALRKQISRLWGAIAARYSDEPAIMGYDLLNEPAMANWAVLNEFYQDTIDEIRKSDRNHVIILEGDHFSMDFSGLAHFNDDQIALGFHYYPTVWHPELVDRNLDAASRREIIARGLDRLIAIGDEFNCPALCGEFGYSANDCGGEDIAMEFLTETIDLIEDRKIDWLLWCYKDAQFMGMVSPKQDTGWMRLANEVRLQWSQDIEKDQAQVVLDLISSRWYPNLTAEERYLLQFRVRACLYLLQRNHILLPRLSELTEEQILMMSGEFAMEHCEIHFSFMDLIKGVLLAE